MNKIIQQTTSAISYIHVLTALWMSSTLLFVYDYQRWALIFFFSTYVLDYTINKRWTSFKWDKDKWEYIAFLLFFLLIPARHLFEATTNSHYVEALNYRLPFIGFGIIGLFGVSSKYKLRYFGYALLATSIITSLYLIFHKIGFLEFWNSSDQTILFKDARIASVNAHMTFNLYLNTSLIFAGYIITRKDISTIIRTIVGIGASFLFYILYISEGRTGFITANLLLVFFVLYRLWFLYRKAFIPSVILLGIILFLSLSHHQRLTPEALERNPRSAIWEVALEVIREKPIVGHGVAEGRQRFLDKGFQDSGFVEIYVTPDFVNIPENKHTDKYMIHPHNVFLDVMIDFGIIGLLLTLFWMFYPLVMGPIKHQAFFIMFIGVFFLQSLFESLGPHLMPLIFGLNIILWNLGSDDSFCRKEDQTN